MVENTLLEIESSKSTLERLIYRRCGSLVRHIERSLVQPYDSLVLYKFRDHLPRIADVSGDLEFLALSLGWLAGSAPDYPTPRVVRVFSRDWFVEVCAALQAAGGVAALAQFLYQIRHDRRVKRQELRTTTSAHPVSAAPGQVQIQRRVSRYHEMVSYSSIGDFQIEKVAEYYEEQLEYVEVYEASGKVLRIQYRAEGADRGDEHSGYQPIAADGAARRR